MPTVNWDIFQNLPGSAEKNFEMLCRCLTRRHYARYGDFAALANQPGVEFHLKLHTPCSLGKPGQWYGWQCRWYALMSGRALGAARRKKIEKAIATTEKELPGITDWVLWTRHALTKGDQAWFYGLPTHMRRHLWASDEVEEHLSGEAEIFRATYFGELVLTPDGLTALHQRAAAQIGRRWQPEVHQTVDAERAIRRMLGEPEAWNAVQRLAGILQLEGRSVRANMADLVGPLAESTAEVVRLVDGFTLALTATGKGLTNGDLDLLRETLAARRGLPDAKLAALPRRLRSAGHRAALFLTNALANIRSAHTLQSEINRELSTRIISVKADAGCGKTQLAAHLSAADSNRPAGILLHGRDLHAGHTLDDLAHHITVQAEPVRSMERLVAALDAAGQRAYRRLPLVIDGLNEAEDPRAWKPLLASLYEALKGYPYVLVVCTVRTAFVDEALPDCVETLELPGFGRDVYDAIRRYFAHYRIDFTDARLPVRLLSHPLTLHLFCEVTNPARGKIVGVESMPESLTALFDRYLKQASERIAELAPRSHRYYEQDVRQALDLVGGLLWENRARDLDEEDLRERLGDSSRPWNESMVRALEQEGVVLRFPGKETKGTRVGAAYDLLGGHLAADAIITTYGNRGFESWFKSESTVKSLTGPMPGQHPLANDILRALVGLVPRRLHRQQVWPLLDEPERTFALQQAAELEGNYLDAATVNELAAHVIQPPSGPADLLDRLWRTRGAPAHPLNSAFLDGILRPMSLRNRDLRWSEWIRRGGPELIEDLKWLEAQWREREVLRADAEQLRAKWVMWLLTSTVREVRDRATRTLYWFGRRDPNELFKLAVNSLEINDPYVSERMLAAAYGVCMALHCRPKLEKFRADLLPKLARRIYEEMFAATALHSTTHALTRDFARGIIDIARVHNPSLLSSSEESRVVPPFKEGGIREWPVMDDPNEGKYRDGNSPLGMDFANYTIGSLVPKRQNWDLEDKEYVRVLGQIVWRIYQLGYSLEAFGDVDKQIAAGRYRWGDERPAVDRYGKKYARIAYFEQYGFRKDAGLLDEEWHMMGERPLDADIDPSFPEHPYPMRLIGDLLGDRSRDVDMWVQQGPVPDFGRYLVPQNIGSATGPWVMLEGHRSQNDKTAERNGFVKLQGFLLLKEDASEFVRLMKGKSPGGDWLPGVEEDDLIFAGEVPWRDTFPHNALSTVDFVIGKARVKVSAKDPRHNLRAALLLGRLAPLAGPGRPPRFDYVNVYERIPVYVPVRRNRFPSHAGTERPSCLVPAKVLTSCFRLWLALPTWNMFDQSGRLCTIATAEGSEPSHERYLFVKRDLIDTFLAKQNLALVWVAWGERQHYPLPQTPTGSDYLGYKYFHRVYRHTRSGPKREV
jgi:hypothetical protein